MRYWHLNCIYGPGPLVALRRSFQAISSQGERRKKAQTLVVLTRRTGPSEQAGRTLGCTERSDVLALKLKN